MIRMIQSSSAGHAKDYFSYSLSKADYFINDQELNGKIQGLLADRLGISGPATKETFFDLCENINPKTGEPLTPRVKQDRRVGYDINFHCPKSVSILHGLSDDGHVLEAFQTSVNETMRHIEADAKTRVRKGGKYDDRHTGELLWADFVHQTARPVEGSLPDPHLHAHCFVFNATWDDVEKEVKAGQFGDIKRDMPYYQARFHKVLSDKLIDLGYQIRLTDKSFEIEGVPQNAIDLFSKRSDEIDRVAKEKGITDAKDLDELGARTRSKKQKGVGMDELRSDWKRQLAQLEEDRKGSGKQIVRFGSQKTQDLLNPQKCVDHAVEHGFERASVLADRRLLVSAYRFGIGNNSVSVNEISDRFEKDDRIIHVKDGSRTLCTTKQVLAEEQRMVNLARQGQGAHAPLYKEAPALNLEGQQAEAVSHILTTTNRVSIIRGAAGSGKTTLMLEAVKCIEDTGKKVTVVAPTSQASRGVLRDEGFETAETVSKLLSDQAMQDGLKGQVLWVDEAGLLGTADMSSLLELVNKKNARLILGGDTRQHSSVVRGDALRILNTVGGIQTAEVNKIYRQRNEQYRAAVEDLSTGDVKSAFDKLDLIGSIKSVDPLKPNEGLVNDYIKAVRKGNTALVVSPTHQQSEDVTGTIRERLRSSGLLGKKQIHAKRLTNLNLTEAQKSDWRNFEKGMVVQFSQNIPGIKRGSMWMVDSSCDQEVRIRNDQDITTTLPQHRSEDYEVYKQNLINLSKGDLLRITRNGFDIDKKRLNNGQILQVKSVTKKGDVALVNNISKAEYKIDNLYGHIAHAYCITSHASQGKTVDEVFISQPAATFPATDSKQIYVSVSRGRSMVRIYTDDKEQLMEHAAKLGDRESALELIQKQKQVNEMVYQHLRDQMARTPPLKTKTRDMQKSPSKGRSYEPGL